MTPRGSGMLGRAAVLGLAALASSCQPRSERGDGSTGTGAGPEPIGAAPTQVDTGRVAYEGNCAMCHGTSGGGDGPLAAELSRQGAAEPTPLVERALRDRLGRRGILGAALAGPRHSGAAYVVPPWSASIGTVLAERIADYVLSLSDSSRAAAASSGGTAGAPATSAPSRGRELYAAYCTTCHGEGGRGDGFYAETLWTQNGVRPRDLTDSGYFARRADREIQAALSMGGGHLGRSIYMPAWNHSLPSEQVRELVREVRMFSRTSEGR